MPLSNVRRRLLPTVHWPCMMIPAHSPVPSMPEIMCFVLGGRHQRVERSRLPLFTHCNVRRS